MFLLNLKNKGIYVWIEELSFKRLNEKVKKWYWIKRLELKKRKKKLKRKKEK
jgi:hypothetical protein